MRSRWIADAASGLPDDLGQLVYASRLLGEEHALVLHGGGNTSYKTHDQIDSAPAEAMLYVKGSGSDLARVEESDFTPIQQREVSRLIETSDMSNAALAEAVSRHVTRPGAPRPSIETLLHAVLPWKFVVHTHADSILAIVNTASGPQLAAEVFGELAPLVPFRASGFALAKAAAQTYRERATPASIGLILLHHGVFAFGASARSAYENMLRLVTLAEDYLKERGAWHLPDGNGTSAAWDAMLIARLRRDLSRIAGFPLLLRRQHYALADTFAARADLHVACQQGPATPQHAVFIKRVPMLGEDIGQYARAYATYVAEEHPNTGLEELGLDAAPRVVLSPKLGAWVAGVNPHFLQATGDVLRQDLEVIYRASAHDRYAGLPPSAILDAEIHYGGFERRLRETGGPSVSLLGESVLLCVADETRSQEIATALGARGAAVCRLSDVPLPAAEGEQVLLPRPGSGARSTALRELVRHFGGMDAVVVDADHASWLEDCAPLLRQAPRGGRAVVLGDADQLRSMQVNTSRWTGDFRVGWSDTGAVSVELPEQVASDVATLLAASPPHSHEVHVPRKEH